MRHLILGAVAVAKAMSASVAPNSTYYNPVLSGWHSDPSCCFVDGITYCATSTFDAFPGLPIYASVDLINWRLVSRAWSRQSQLPEDIQNQTMSQQGGFFAPNMRHHDGKFYVSYPRVTCVYVTGATRATFGAVGAVFVADEPYSDESWADAVTFNVSSIDPDLFWDDDGTVYMASAGIILQEINLDTGAVTEPISIWNGTGGASPEGPHIYKKDGYYYLMIAEGGTELGHMETIARSRNIIGPYESNPNNPVITNANTTEYFQTVGHADLFQDARGNWWGMCLTTRSGPAWEIYPMGREAALFPVTWNEGEFPYASQIRGVMNGWRLPPASRQVAGQGQFNCDPDVVDFAPGTSLPNHFMFWRYPLADAFQVSPPGHPHTLQIMPSPSNLTGGVFGTESISFVGRRQTDTLFVFSVDLAYNSSSAPAEVGVSLFLTQDQHIDLSIAKLGDSRTPVFQVHIEASGAPNLTSTVTTTSIPASWLNEEGCSLRLQVQTTNDTTYELSAFPAAGPNAKSIIGYASAEVVSGGSGPFTGTLAGVYATCSGTEVGYSNASACPVGIAAYFSRWRYTPIAQYVSATEIVAPF